MSTGSYRCEVGWWGGGGVGGGGGGVFFFNDTATTEIYTLSLHDALPISSAVALTADQSKKLADTLKAQVGKTVKVNATVDEDLIGGLVVKVGSKMIDTSIRSRLASLQNAMKEVG